MIGHARNVDEYVGTNVLPRERHGRDHKFNDGASARPKPILEDGAQIPGP